LNKFFHKESAADINELTFSNPSSNGTTSTDKRNRKNLTVAVQLLPHAAGDKSARRAATPYLFPQLPSVKILHLPFASVRVIRGSKIFTSKIKAQQSLRHPSAPPMRADKSALL
jgi:hypothetical protein